MSLGKETKMISLAQNLTKLRIMMSRFSDTQIHHKARESDSKPATIMASAICAGFLKTPRNRFCFPFVPGAPARVYRVTPMSYGQQRVFRWLLLYCQFKPKADNNAGALSWNLFWGDPGMLTGLEELNHDGDGYSVMSQDVSCLLYSATKKKLPMIMHVSIMFQRRKS